MRHHIDSTMDNIMPTKSGSTFNNVEVAALVGKLTLIHNRLDYCVGTFAFNHKYVPEKLQSVRHSSFVYPVTLMFPHC